MNIKECHVVTAYAERAAGPGWANSPIWVIVRDGDKRLHQICIQPEERTAHLHYLYDVSAASHAAMKAAAEEWLANMIKSDDNS